jgi:hypothetical protein
MGVELKINYYIGFIPVCVGIQMGATAEPKYFEVC